MKKGFVVASLSGVLLLAGVTGYTRGDDSGPLPIRAMDPQAAEMRPAPIDPTWIVSGRPEAQAASLGGTSDGSTQVYLWQTTAGTFHWHYGSDEIIHIVDGEVFVTDGTGVERRLGPGDVAMFPRGARTTWRVPDHLRKIAILKNSLPGFVEAPIRWARSAKAWVKPQSAFAAD